MSLILAHRKRKLIRDITIKDSAGAMVSPGVNDTVRIKIGKLRQVPSLDLGSDVATTGGSTITKNSPTAGVSRVQISQTDLSSMQAGVYSFEVSLVDNADAQAIKHVDMQIMVLQDTMLGKVGLT